MFSNPIATVSVIDKQEFSVLFHTAAAFRLIKYCIQTAMQVCRALPLHWPSNIFVSKVMARNSVIKGIINQYVFQAITFGPEAPKS